MSFIGRVGKALGGLFGTPKRRSPPVQPPEEIKRPPPEDIQVPPGGGDEYVTYPDDWSHKDRVFWDSVIDPEYRRYYTAPEWDAAQKEFELGWFHPRWSKESKETHRKRFFRITGSTEKQFNWGAYREWIDSPKK